MIENKLTELQTGVSEAVKVEMQVIPPANFIINRFMLEKRNAGNAFVLNNIYVNNYECDILSVTRSGYMNEYEVKISKADYKKDFEKTMGIISKHNKIKGGERLNKFWFIVPENMVDVLEVPEYAGLIYFKKYNNNGSLIFETQKEAPFLHKNKLLEKPALLYDLAQKCYWRIPFKKMAAV